MLYYLGGLVLSEIKTRPSLYDILFLQILISRDVGQLYLCLHLFRLADI